MSSLYLVLVLFQNTTDGRIPFVGLLEHLKTEHLVGAFRTERVFAGLQAFVYLDSIEVGAEAGDVDADGLGRVLGREQDLAAPTLGIELEELQAVGDQLGGLQ